MKRKLIGISCGVLARRYGDVRALEMCAEAGFDAVDFNLLHFDVSKDTIYRRSDEEIVAYFAQLKRRAEELGIIISQTHGRTATYRPSDERNNAWVREVSRRDLLATAALGAPACVIHSISTGRWLDASPEQMRRENIKMYHDLIPFAEQYGVAIALETFGDCRPNGVRRLDFFGDVSELKEQYDALRTSCKTLCMDTGHTHKAHDVAPSVSDAADAIRYLGKDITLLHLNDNNGFSDQHLPPLLAGDRFQLDWKDIMCALDEIGYEGIYNFELSLDGVGSAMEAYLHFLSAHLRSIVENVG